MSINDFIKLIVNECNTNEKNYSRDDFYYMLKYLGIKKDKSLVNDIKKFYQDFLNSLNNSLVKFDERKLGSGENTTHYIAFYTDKKADYLEAVKVYFPVKYEYMISALKTVFLYLIRNNIESTVKFHVKSTNEGIVIRFYKKNDVKPFIDYCNNNFVLSDLLENLNPFIAKTHGIGVVQDDNTLKTFNETVADMLYEYFSFLKQNGSFDLASDLDFLDYVMKRANIEENDVLRFNIRAVEHSIESILNRSNPLK